MRMAQQRGSDDVDDDVFGVKPVRFLNLSNDSTHVEGFQSR